LNLRLQASIFFQDRLKILNVNAIPLSRARLGITPEAVQAVQLQRQIEETNLLQKQPEEPR
jgi:hypothetical protein